MAVKKIVKEGYAGLSTEGLTNEVYDLCGKARQAIVELWMDYQEVTGYSNGAERYTDTFVSAEHDEDYEYIKGLFADVSKGIQEIRKVLINKLNK